MKKEKIQTYFWYADKHDNVATVGYQNKKGTRFFALKMIPTKSRIFFLFQKKFFPLICKWCCLLGFSRDTLRSNY